MIPASPDGLTPTWVKSLIENGIGESTRLEYKSQLPGKSREDKLKFLYGITAFANTDGGVILYGVAEDKDEGNTGIPRAADGIGSQNEDEVESWMNNLINDAVEPRIEGTQYRWILYNGAQLLAVWVPSSWQAPHMVALERVRRFYGRSSTSAYPLAVSEIRNIVLGRNQAPARIRAFHADRVDEVQRGETPVLVRESSYFLMHVVPINEFMGGGAIDVSEAVYPRSDAATSFTSRWNLDGRVGWSVFGSGGGEAIDYCQLFRNGSLEVLETWWLTPLADGGGEISGEALRAAVAYCQDFSKELAKRGASYPMIVMVSLIGVEGYKMTGGANFFEGIGAPKAMDRNVVMLPDRILRGDDSDSEVVDEFINITWQAAGWSGEHQHHSLGKRQ